jgi:hypothetical protein
VYDSAITRRLGLLLLLVGLAPACLTAQPLSAQVDPRTTNVALGTTVTFCVQAQGTGPFFYQWKKNGVALPGQTSDCLILSSITISNGGSYRATVTDASGALESEEAFLTVVLDVLPGDNQFGNSTAIAGASNSVRGDSFSATREASEPLHFNLRTSNSVWYVWTAPTNGIITFDTEGSTFDTVLAVYVGSYLNTLNEVASDDDSGDFHTSRVSWNAQAGTNYRVVIDGVTGETGTYACNWNLEVTADQLPVFTRKPENQTVLTGGTATFTAAATNIVWGLTYQWFQNGALIPGATSSNLTIYNVQTPNLGEYRVAVTNSAGRSVMSAPVVLEIGPDPSVQSRDKIAEVPFSDGGGGALPSSSALSPTLSMAPSAFGASSASAGTFSLAAGTIINQRFFNSGTTDRCEPAHCGANGGASRWFELKATSDGICTVDTQGSDVDTILAIYLQNFAICTNLYEPLVDCNNDALGSCEQMLAPNSVRERSSRVSFFATAGTVYRAVVDTVGGVRGTNIQFNVRFESPPSLPAKGVQLNASTNFLLQPRGSTVTLHAPTNLVSPKSVYIWRFNGRRIAGAARDRLLLPYLNYGDAGRYSAIVDNGGNRTVVPGAALLVVDPCRAEPRLIGIVRESNILLETTSTLMITSSWQLIGPIAPSNQPTVWDARTGPIRFYRAFRSPP